MIKISREIEKKILSDAKSMDKNFDEVKAIQSWKHELVYNLLKTENEYKVLEKGMPYVSDEEIYQFREYINFVNGKLEISEINKEKALITSELFFKFIPIKELEKFNETGKSIKKYLRHLKARKELLG